MRIVVAAVIVTMTVVVPMAMPVVVMPAPAQQPNACDVHGQAQA